MIFLIFGLMVLGTFLYRKSLIKSFRMLYNFFPYQMTIFIFVVAFGGIFILATRSLMFGVLGLGIFLLFYVIQYLSSLKTKSEKSSKSDIKVKTRKEALEIFGLAENAKKEDILRAHRDLLKRLHPDLGGSNYLTALINEAKEILISD